ncbi:MAG: hypothetical protein CVV57_10730 [Tenericutes bacterium HGW-Tenericutes-2]|jgi:Na+-transporting NADH:ubiquinone oxidoreductase subunit C|nr:MAG: hypothetical protein CVV57_10730 [Tenericutes bacterium HGW-Tenericutes-2]
MKEQLKMILFTIILGLASSGILMGMDAYTSDKIIENEELAFKKSVLKAFEIDYEASEIVDVFSNQIERIEKDGYNFYESSSGAIGFEFEGSGLWGPIAGFLTLEEDLVTIQDIQIMEQSETPGLGGIIAEADYLAKYKGKVFDPDIVVVKANDQENAINEVDAITGATGTSRAFETLLNAAYKTKKEVLVN